MIGDASVDQSKNLTLSEFISQTLSQHSHLIMIKIRFLCSVACSETTVRLEIRAL